ncbi:hypothetical protein BDZ97DRAFT_1732228 [Flammula alnicola]|nr:hypothetical protein BDZ97DRAFT_1732228 [Flammula alnicola]
MFSVRLVARNGRLLPAARTAGPRALPSVSRTSFRSFWDQKQSEYPKETTKRQSAEEEPPPPEPEPEKVGQTDNVERTPMRSLAPYLTGLLVVGIGLTAYGFYGLYEMMTMWPLEIRQDLRSGLRAKRKGDLDIASQYLTRAWERSKTLPREVYGNEPLLKISGIGIALAGVLEESRQLDRAYAVYEDTLWYLRTAYLNLPLSSSTTKKPDLGIETLKILNSAEKMRAVALSYKLGQLAHDLNKPPVEEERWLVWAVEAILRAVMDVPPMGSAEVVRVNGAAQGSNVKVLVEQLGLPEWSAGHDLAAPFEALASFYARVGNVTYALPLYLQAISILIPPPPSPSSIEDKCRGAQLMGNIAELICEIRQRTTCLQRRFPRPSRGRRKASRLSHRRASPRQARMTLRGSICGAAL